MTQNKKLDKAKFLYQQSLLGALQEVESCVVSLEKEYDIIPDPSTIDLFAEDEFLAQDGEMVDDIEFYYTLTRAMFFLINRLQEINECQHRLNP